MISHAIFILCAHAITQYTDHRTSTVFRYFWVYSGMYKPNTRCRSLFFFIYIFRSVFQKLINIGSLQIFCAPPGESVSREQTDWFTIKASTLTYRNHFLTYFSLVCCIQDVSVKKHLLHLTVIIVFQHVSEYFISRQRLFCLSQLCWVGEIAPGLILDQFLTKTSTIWTSYMKECKNTKQTNVSFVFL